MSTLGNLPISRKLTAAFAAVIAIILVSGIIICGRLGVLEATVNQHLKTDHVGKTLDEIIKALLDQETGLRGYLVSADGIFLEPYHQGIHAYTVAFGEAKQLNLDNAAQESRLDELNELAKEWNRSADRRIALMARPETREEARAVAGMKRGKLLMDGIRAKVDQIKAVESELSAKSLAKQKQALATAYAVALIGGTSSLAVAMVMGFLLMRTITVPITRTTATMAALAKGDTSVEVPGVGRKDEIGAMAAAVETFRDSIIDRDAAQAQLAHANRVSTMGQLTASIAHEVNQPIAAALNNARAALRWLSARPPDVEEAREAIGAIVDNGQRANDVIGQIRDLIKKAPPRRDWFDINEAILAVISLTRSEASSHGVSVKTRLATGLPSLHGDRIGLQQVILNLIVNAIEAMSGVGDGVRELQITTATDSSGDVIVALQDSGPGLDSTVLNHVFEAFYTTKPNGMGLGLVICNSIVEAHGGRMWASENQPRGAIFHFTLPAHQTSQSDPVI